MAIAARIIANQQPTRYRKTHSTGHLSLEAGPILQNEPNSDIAPEEALALRM